MVIVGSPTTVANPATIGSLADDVIIKVENRTSDVARARIWLRDAILEVSGNTEFRDDFDELEVLGPTFNLTIGAQEYAFPVQLVPVGDFNLATLDIMLWIDPPTNLLRRKLRNTSYQEADKFQILNATPNSWYRFGNTVGFIPVPDKTYQVQARLLRQHPINDSALEITQILLPRDWNEILCWSAAERGFAELLEYEKAAAIHAMLHGDPKYPERPGLIAGRKKRREREDWRQEKALRPIVRRYMDLPG
jgi:hypothetical protein